MARTPLLRSLRTLFTEYRAARALGLPLHGLRETRAEQEHKVKSGAVPPVDRRRFLVGAGAAALAIGLPSSARAKKAAPTVAIIGGGIAGLNCALQLADRNIDATVYEASGRLGGRMFSHTSGYWAQGQISEWCGELIDTGHKTVRNLAKRFDLPLDDLLDAQLPGSEDTYRFFGGYYPKAQADVDFEGVFDALADDLDAAGYPTSFDDFTATGQALDALSIHDWIETRVPGGHGSPLGMLLDTAYVIEYGAPTTDQSSLNLIYLLGYQPAQGGPAAFGESDERFHIRGGNQQLPEAMAAHLGVGDAVKLGHRLTRIKQTASGRYQLNFDHNASSKTLTADYVVLALPFAVLRDLDYGQAGFDALKDEAIQELGRGQNGKLQLQFSNRHWNQTGPWPGRSNGSTYSDTGYQASWEVSRAQPGSRGLMVLYSGGAATAGMSTGTPFATASNPDVQADAAQGLSQIEPVFPGLSAKWNGKATQSLPHLSSFFKASYAYYRVGQYTSFGGYEKARQGGVLFGGEHTSTDFQGFMEGGATEGARCAKELDKLIK